MIVTTPLRKPASAPSEFDEAVSHGPADARRREPASARSAFDESATREPVEVLIKEARNRARRRRLVFGAIAAATVAVAAISITAGLDDGGPPQGQGTELGAPAGATSLGVFEPLRGRIVYPVGLELKAIDPADPSSVHTLALPDELAADLSAGIPLLPAGWSADGTRLALTSEHSGKSYVMDADGAITRVRGHRGCCLFVTEPWLSPDGTTAVELVEANQIHLVDFEGGGASRVIELEPPVGGDLFQFVPVHAWSPDGTRIAYTVHQQVGTDLVPSVYVVDLDTGNTRELVGPGFGHIRHMTWSPDGSQLLVIAGPWRASTVDTGLNPLVGPQETGLYLVGTDNSAPAVPASALNPIASGHYIAATWSPDGDQLAAIDWRSLVTMRADGSESRVLVDLPWSELFTGLAWHPIPSDR